MAFLKHASFLAIFLCLFTGNPHQAAALNLSLQEQEIKAGLVYNFLKYTDWPPEAGGQEEAPIAICLFGKDTFGNYLRPLTERTVNRKSIALRNVQQPDEAAQCHLLFIGEKNMENWPELHDSLQGKSVLTVSDAENFVASGGMIGFGHKDQRISVELDMEAVKASRLHIQDRLLKLVTIVSKTGGRP